MNKERELSYLLQESIAVQFIELKEERKSIWL
jgi:hypothetical protein